MRRALLTAFATISLVFIYVNCGKSDSGSGSPVKITGSFSAGDYTTAQNFGAFDRLWSLIIQGVTFAAGTKLTEVWALPLYEGEFHPQAFDGVKKSTPNGGSLEIELDQRNWVALLIDGDQAAKKDKIVGYLSMTAGSAGLTSLPLSKASNTIELGTLTKKNDETSSSKNENDTAASYGLNTTQLLSLANSDDGIKTVKNAYRNYNDGTYVSVKPFFVWRRTSASAAISNTFSSVDTLVNDNFYGYLFYMNTNHSAMNYSGICNQSVALKLIPPTTVENFSGNTWTPAAPFDSTSGSQSTSGNSCGAGQLYLREDNFSGKVSYQFNFSAGSGSSNEYLKPPIVAGDWTIKVGSTTIGEFEANVGSIFEGDDTKKPIVFMPSLKANVTGTTVDSVEVKFYLRNSSTGGFELVTDSTLLSQLASPTISLTDYSGERKEDRSASGLAPDANGVFKFTPSKSFTMTSGLSIDVDYNFNNIAIHVEHRL